MFMVHVERSGTVLPFFVGVSTQSPLPSSCLEYGGLQCSHIFIIRCVFIVFIHGLFHFLVPFNVLFIFIYVHLFSFIFIFLIYFHVFSFFSFPAFFSLEKTITNLNHLHVDPRLSSADSSISQSCSHLWSDQLQLLLDRFQQAFSSISLRWQRWLRHHVPDTEHHRHAPLPGGSSEGLHGPFP